MQTRPGPLLLAAFLSLILHAGVLAVMGSGLWRTALQKSIETPQQVVHLELLQPQVELGSAEAPIPAPVSPITPAPLPPGPMVPIPPQPPAVAKQEAISTSAGVAHMDAPPAPTTEEWAAAATYTLKNSKRYRYTWGQQVRSMMGTAFEGPDQGIVRFRVHIAPNGQMIELETLWSTSDKAEQLARQAIEQMPPLPPTPTGLPLVFEKTISFQPFAAEGPPIYKHDCEPDPPSFRNPFAWDGRTPRPSTSGRQDQDDDATQPAPDPQALEDCRRQLAEDTVEAEAAHDKRLLEQWRSSRLGR